MSEKEAFQKSADDVKHLQANKKLIMEIPFTVDKETKTQSSAKPSNLK